MQNGAMRAFLLYWRGGRDGPVGERSAIMGSVRLSLCSVGMPAKIENRTGNCGQGCEGKLILRKSSLSG